MQHSTILKKDERGVFTLTLNRPERHNAFDDAMIAELIELLRSVDADSHCRLLLLTANGKSFSAGADLNWMRRMADYDKAQNLADSLQLAELMRVLNTLSKPTLAVVQGAAFGGGVGLVACCDIVVATERAKFCLSEVKLGLIPAVISPYVVAAIGQSAARRYFITADRFDANRAFQLGLVDEVVADAELASSIEKITKAVLAGGPAAQYAAKKLVAEVDNRPINEELLQLTAERIAHIRASEEGREGLNAFLEKRPPNWVK